MLPAGVYRRGILLFSGIHRCEIFDLLMKELWGSWTEPTPASA
jgi:hypothetical protein